MFEPFARADQRRWGQVYLRGLLLDGRRKSVEPTAVRLGEDGNRQALANFITTSPWDAAQVRSAGGVEPLEAALAEWRARLSARGRAMVSGAAELEAYLRARG
ncbi:transposase [Streptomyces sp. NPDC101213]|uniref:transposase n=1 Tax=Streptomyces sp. NPDC101213 TaxID=3366130 RepID=UPI0037F60AF3